MEEAEAIPEFPGENFSFGNLFGPRDTYGMRNIKGYIDHILQESSDAYKEDLPLDTRQYIEKKVIPRMGMQKKDLSDLVSDGWSPRVPMEGVPIRLHNDDVGLLECIPMFGGKDVIVIRFTPKEFRPLEYFTRGGGFADLLTMAPEEDAKDLSHMCSDFTLSIVRRLQKIQRSKRIFGRG